MTTANEKPDSPQVAAARIETARARSKLMGTAHELQERLSPKTLTRDAWITKARPRTSDSFNFGATTVSLMPVALAVRAGRSPL